MKKRSLGAEAEIQSYFERTGISSNSQITSPMASQPYYCDYNGLRFIGYVFYTKDVGLMFCPLDYPFYLTGLIRGGRMVFAWQESNSYISTHNQTPTNVTVNVWT